MEELTYIMRTVLYFYNEVTRNAVFSRIFLIFRALVVTDRESPSLSSIRETKTSQLFSQESGTLHPIMVLALMLAVMSQQAGLQNK